MSLALDLAKAVAVSLNDGVAPSTHQAVARVMPRREEDVIESFIDVLPAGQSREIESRNTPDPKQTILIVISSTIPWDQDEEDHSTEAFDSLLSICESIADHYLGEVVLDVGTKQAAALAVRIGDEVGLIVDDNMLDGNGIGLCKIEVDFRIS